MKKKSTKLVKKWPKYAHKLFSWPKKVQNVVSGLEFFFANLVKNDQKIAKRCCLGLKRVQKVIFGHKFFFDQIGQKMAKMWSKDFSMAKKGPKSGFRPR